MPTNVLLDTDLVSAAKKRKPDHQCVWLSTDIKIPLIIFPQSLFEYVLLHWNIFVEHEISENITYTQCFF